MNEIPTYQYKKGATSGINNAWWLEAKNEAYAHICAKVTSIRKNQAQRRTDWLRFARLYTNTDFDQFISGVVNTVMGRKLSFNVCRSCVDTAAARISKAKPRPLFLTEKGNFSQQNRAKKLTQYSDGMFYSTKMYRIGRRVFKDAAIFGTGAIKFYKEDGEVKAERVFIDEIVVDEIDGREMQPRELHQTKLVHKEVLISKYPKFADEIKAASIPFDRAQGKKAVADMVGVIESWHLPSGKDEKDGRHVICLDSCTLLDEPYEKDNFPFVFFRWNEPLLGFYGEGLISQLVGIQLEINTVLMRIKEGLEIVAVPRVLLEETSGVSSSHITDEIGGIIKYRGAKPDFITPQAFNREVYDYLEYLYQKAFQDSGISQLSATSKKPAGLDSRVALREYQDIESERFALVAEAYQTLYLDSAAQIIALQRELAEDKVNTTVQVPNGDFIESIKWSEVSLDADKFIMQPYPTNFLPKTPEGQLEFTQELIQAGFVEPEEAMSLLNFPDTKAFFNLKTAAIDDIKLIIERAIEDGEYTPPEPYMNLQLGIRMVQAAYLRAKTDGTPEDRRELLVRFIDECESLLASVAQAQSAQAGAMGAAGAIAQPAQAPVSDLLPITPQAPTVQ